MDNIVEQFGLGSDQIDSFNSVNDDTYWLVQQDISAYKTLGFFARINYDYKGKYLFEASMRADGTSRFAKRIAGATSPRCRPAGVSPKSGSWRASATGGTTVRSACRTVRWATSR